MASAIDPESIETLRSINPDDGGEFLRELITIFQTDSPTRIAELRAALARGDAATVSRAAHSMKGSAGNFGAAAFAEINRQIEQLGKQGALSEIPTLLPALDAEYDRVKAALDQVVASFNR